MDLLPNLVSVNLSNNRLTELPDLSNSRIEELNISYNPIEALDVGRLPGTLKQISISGLPFPRDAVLARFPNVEFVESPEPMRVTVTEVEQKLELQDIQDQVKSKAEEDKKKGKNVPRKTHPAVRAPLLQSKSGEQLKSGIKPVSKVLPKRKSAQVVEADIHEQHVAIRDDTQKIEDVQRTLAQRYQDALNEISEMKMDSFNSHIDDIIEQSKSRVL